MRPDDTETKAFHLLALRYLSGEASGVEREQLVTQLKKPTWHAQFENIRYVWEQTAETHETAPFDADQAVRRFEAKVAGKRSKPAAAHPGRKSSKPKRSPAWKPDGRTLMLAASLAIAFTMLGIAFFPKREQTARNPAPSVQRINGVGERSIVTLRDGSSVTLNAGSTLSYPEAFDRHTRSVRLTGEAYFDVAHDETRPFVVETATLRITVLGTKFNVTAFNDGTRAQVALMQGRVQVTGVGPHGETTPVELAPGNQYSFSPSTGIGQVRTIAPEAVNGWIEDRLILDKEPVDSIMRRLERRFGVPIEIRDASLGEEPITGRFNAESIVEIFELLHLTGVLDYQVVRAEGGIERVIVSPGRSINRTRQNNGR